MSISDDPTAPGQEDRPNNREVEYEQERPAADGEPPRPATEPPGAKHSQDNAPTATDPGTGAPR